MASDLIEYASLLDEIKGHIRRAQTRAVSSANREMLVLYWDVGRLIESRQAVEGWGSGVIPRLSRDLRNELPGIKGFSDRNLKWMIRFYREYTVLISIVPQPVAQMSTDAESPPLAEAVLKLMIESQAHARQGEPTTNFAARLPAPQSDLVQLALKDPYVFDFLTLDKPFWERELETGLIAHLETELSELRR